jgi:hypothetical protein
MLILELTELTRMEVRLMEILGLTKKHVDSFPRIIALQQDRISDASKTKLTSQQIGRFFLLSWGTNEEVAFWHLNLRLFHVGYVPIADRMGQEL